VSSTILSSLFFAILERADISVVSRLMVPSLISCLSASHIFLLLSFVKWVLSSSVLIMLICWFGCGFSAAPITASSQSVID